MIVIDIEMPKSCTECPVFDNERLECQATGEKCKDWSFEPTQNCPIKYDFGQIRAEIDAMLTDDYDGKYVVEKDKVLQIIDKYAEGEEG